MAEVYRTPDGSSVCITMSAEEAPVYLAAPQIMESLDPDTLDAIADELTEFHHSARAGSLRAVARWQRAALAQARGET